MLTSCSLPSLIWIKLGILPRRSSNVGILTAALVVRTGAHRNSDKDRWDRRGVRIVQVDTKRFVDIQLAGSADQTPRAVGVDAPVARGVRIGQRMARDLAANTHVVELLRLRNEACFDVAQTLS